MTQCSKSRGVVSARRRLLRGSFAAPAVLALHSGNVLAAASNLRCLANGSQPIPVVDAADTIMRVRLYKVGNAKLYLNGADVYGVVSSTGGRVGVDGTFLSSSSVWREVTIGLNGTVTLGAPVTSVPGGATQGDKYIALRFAPGSTIPVEIIGVVDGTSTVGSAASFNCWSSFAGIAP